MPEGGGSGEPYEIDNRVAQVPPHQQQILPALDEGRRAFPPGQRTANPQEIRCVHLFSSLCLAMRLPSQEPSHP